MEEVRLYYAPSGSKLYPQGHDAKQHSLS